MGDGPRDQRWMVAGGYDAGRDRPVGPRWEMLEVGGEAVRREG